MRRTTRIVLLALAFAPAAACGDAGSDGGGGAGGAASVTPSATGSTGSSCALDDATTESGTVADSGCAVLNRDTSACEAARQAAGLSGYWLQFSCRVELSMTANAGASVIEAKSDGQPDYPSNYIPDADPCHDDYTAAIQNPNHIAAQSYDVVFPTAPSGGSQKMSGAVVGLALNGVPIFGNFAAPGDDIYEEAETFDQCGGHPQMSGAYHYHTEPYAISFDDSRLVGVMRDGYPIYGRRDPDGSLPTLDEAGGHTDVTADSPTTPVYHYHVHLETSSTPASAGQQAWFITTGTYHSTPAACASCM
jgi:hypothetical protein